MKSRESLARSQDADTDLPRVSTDADGGRYAPESQAEPTQFTNKLDYAPPPRVMSVGAVLLRTLVAGLAIFFGMLGTFALVPALVGLWELLVPGQSPHVGYAGAVIAMAAAGLLLLRMANLCLREALRRAE